MRTGLLAIGIAALAVGPAGDARIALHGGAPDIPELATLPKAMVAVDHERAEVTIELPPIDVEAAAPGSERMVNLPVDQVVMPVSCSIYGARVEVRDQSGRVLPATFLHHLNLTDPSHRDLFLPASLHILAASKETPPLRVPPLVMGLPLEQGQRLLVWAMLANETGAAYHSVRVRLLLGCRPRGSGLFGSVFPIFRGYPWGLDAMFPLGKRPDGSKAFDLPPGRSSKSWESSPAVPGTIVGIGGHVHDHALSLELQDATTGEVIWHGTPVRDQQGRVLQMPVKRFYNWHSLGVHILPSHRYRVTVAYENLTNHTILDGGMGSVGGLFVPDRGVTWPPVDTSDAIYRQDLADIFVPGDMGGMEMVGAR